MPGQFFGGSTGIVVGAAGGGGGAAPWGDPVVPDSTATDTEWDGDDAAGFTEVTVSGSQTITEGDSILSVAFKNMASDDTNGLVVAKSFSVGDAWAVPVRMLGFRTATNANKVGIVFADGTASGSNTVFGHIQLGSTALLVGRHGTWDAMGTVPWVSDTIVLYTQPWIWIKLTYVSANTFRLEFSPDGLSWSAFGIADFSKTMTPTHVGVAWAGQESSDTIGTFGPLRKVA